MQDKGSKLYFGLSLYLHPYFVYASIEGSGADLPEPTLLTDVIST